MNLRIWTKVVSIELGRQQKSDYVLKRVHLFTSEKVKIIEVLSFKGNNQFLLPFSYLIY